MCSMLSPIFHPSLFLYWPLPITQYFPLWMVSLVIIRSRWTRSTLRKLFSGLPWIISLYNHVVRSKKRWFHVPMCHDYHFSWHVWSAGSLYRWYCCKFQRVFNHVNILKKVFDRCRQYKLRMNHLKCAFGVFSFRKFLGFTI